MKSLNLSTPTHPNPTNPNHAQELLAFPKRHTMTQTD